MKHVIKGLFSIVLLTSMTMQAADVNGRSFFLSNVGNAAGNGLIEQAGRAGQYDSDATYGCFSVHSEYGQNTKREDIGKYLFFNGTNAMIAGPQRTTTTNLTTDIYNVNLLLDDTFVETITALPTVQTFSSTLNFYVGLDEFMEGLYLDASLPIVHTKWDMGLTASALTAGTTTIATGLLEDGATVTSPYTSFIGALKGDKTIGDVTSAMSYHKVDGEQKKTKVGNVKLVAGYNFVNKENCHFGVGALGVINGGGKSDAKYWFEPNIGTGGRHGIGGRVDGHVRMWENDESDITAYVRADVFHALKATVRRTYDWTAHGVGSRYNLLKEMSALATYADVMHQGVNITSLQAKVNMDVVYDVDAMFRWNNGNFCFDVGYGLHGHSKENHKEWVDTIADNKYGAWAPTTADADNAVETLVSTGITVSGIVHTTAPVAQVAATVLRHDDLDTDSGIAPASMTHQVYGNLNYVWDDSEWEPFIGLGGGYAFSGSDNKALNAWHVHTSFGVCF